MQELLRAEIEAIRSGSESAEKVKDLESQIAELESESEHLSEALNAQKAATSNVELAAGKKVDELAKEVRSRVNEVDQLKARLKQYGDYDEIKRELEIMKVSKPTHGILSLLTSLQYVEFAGLDEDDDGDAVNGYDAGVYLPNPNADKANAQQGKSLEALLATKSKRIQEELTKFRVRIVIIFKLLWLTFRADTPHGARSFVAVRAGAARAHEHGVGQAEGPE